MREFVAKSKKIKVTINGTSYEMRCPTIQDNETLNKRLLEEKTENAFQVYIEFFESLDLPIEAIKQMDSDDFLEFITFILTPKKAVAT